MTADDPDKRIADLERQLADAKEAARIDQFRTPPTDSGTSQGPSPWHPSPGQIDPGQPPGFPPPPGWQSPTPSAFSSSAYLPGARRFMSRDRRRRILPALVVAGMIVLVPVLVPGFGFNSLSRPFKHIFSGTTRLQTASGLNSVLAAMRTHFGDTTGYQLLVYPDFATIARPDPQYTQYERTYTYRDGDWSDDGNSTEPPPSDVVADLSKFDVNAVSAQVSSAPQTLNIHDAKLTYLSISGVTGGQLELKIDVGAGVEGVIELNPNGSVKQLHTYALCELPPHCPAQ
jgi:hypothetical protein